MSTKVSVLAKGGNVDYGTPKFKCEAIHQVLDCGHIVAEVAKPISSSSIVFTIVMIAYPLTLRAMEARRSIVLTRHLID